MAFEDLPLTDLKRVLRVALSRGGPLLTAGEAEVVARMRRLHGPAGRLYARITARKPRFFQIDSLARPDIPDPEAAVMELEGLELVDRLVPWSARLEALTSAEMKAICRELGLPVGGRRDDLVERLRDRRWRPRSWVRVRHRPLIHRLERWAMLRRDADRSTLVVERLGHLKWPAYELTPGGRLHRDRRALLAWERYADHIDDLDGDACVDGIVLDSSIAPSRLDLRGSLAWRAVAEARERERQRDLEGALALYRRVEATGVVGRPALAVRIARTLELLGRTSDAVEHLREVRGEARWEDRLKIARTGRRLARAAGVGWAPDAPLSRPRERDLGLPVGEPLPGGRPAYQMCGTNHAVEWAVTWLVEAAGRTVLRGEYPLYTTLYALIMAPAYFLPIPGALPVRYLSGPVDVGTPRFRAPRAEVIDGLLDEVRAGRAEALIRSSDARFRGMLLAGAHWEHLDVEQLVAAARALGSTLVVILETLLDRGWVASSGLPDLLILDGPEVWLPATVPSRLGADAVLVEVKGPGDSLRDEQRVWLDLLRGAVELWKVRAIPSERAGR